MDTRGQQFLKRSFPFSDMDKTQKALFLTLALILVGIILIASVFATNSQKGETSQTNSPVQVSYKVDQTTPQIVQNYNSYDYGNNYNYNPEITNSYVKPVQTYYRDKNEDITCNSYGVNCADYKDEYTEARTIHYSQYETETTRDNLFGDYVKEYSVYVTNRGEIGRYYTVKFNLEDKKGYEFSQSVTQYLKIGESKEFLNWDYNIIPENY